MMKDPHRYLIFIDTTLSDAPSDATILKNMKPWREKMWKDSSYFAGISYQEFGCQELRSRLPHVSSTDQTEAFTGHSVTSSRPHDWMGRIMTSPSQHAALCAMFMMEINHVSIKEEETADFWTQTSSRPRPRSHCSTSFTASTRAELTGDEMWSRLSPETSCPEFCIFNVVFCSEVSLFVSPVWSENMNSLWIFCVLSVHRHASLPVRSRRGAVGRGGHLFSPCWSCPALSDLFVVLRLLLRRRSLAAALVMLLY